MGNEKRMEHMKLVKESARIAKNDNSQLLAKIYAVINNAKAPRDIDIIKELNRMVKTVEQNGARQDLCQRVESTVSKLESRIQERNFRKR